jgi:NAD(P)-dependent dehydrogenase (short-subunit alcohol dehydrogenase family)
MSGDRLASDLHGKVAIVSGAGDPEGIGAASARALGLAGAKLLLADLPSSNVEKTVELLRAEGLDVSSAHVDISEEVQVAALLDLARREFGRLDILDNNASVTGVQHDLLIGDMDVDIWDRAMRVNARGTMLMCKHALPLLIDSGGGSIINISSGTAQAGDNYASAYAASKGAINTLTKYVATQYGHKGIRCNAIAPGLIMTPVLDKSMPMPMQDVFRSHSLTGRLGTARDIAEMVAFLASDRAQFMTGQIVQVDGGIYAHVPTVPGVAALFNRQENAPQSSTQEAGELPMS